MTEQEAKTILSLSPEEKVKLPNLSKVYEIAVQALEDIQKYRTIGTVEECRTAREKQIPMKPMYEGDCCDGSGRLIYDTWICPNCGERYELDYDDYDYDICMNCGQAIDWDGNNDEGGNDDDKDSDESDNQVRTYRHPLADTGTYIL